MSAIILLIVVLAAANIEASAKCDKKLDFVFDVDASTIACRGTEPCPKWTAVLQFCKDVVNGLTIGPDHSKVAFVTASDKAEVEWNFNKYTDSTTLLSAINNVKYKEGEFSTLSLPTAQVFLTEVFNPLGLSGERTDALNVIVFITDGFLELDPLVAAITSTGFQQAGIAVFIVCVAPGCTESLAQEMASPPKKANETYFLVNNYFSLNQVTDNLLKGICSFKLPLIPGLTVIGK